MAISAGKTIVRAIVPKSVAEAIGRMAVASNRSRSAVIADFLTSAEPALRRLAGMMEVASKQQALFPASTVAQLEAALDDLSGNAVDVLDRLEGAQQLAQKPARKRQRTVRSAVGARTVRARS